MARAALGAVLPRRNNAWLNAGPRIWLAFSADNGDIKFPHRIPIVPESHEKMMLFDVARKSCCSSSDIGDMIYDFQAGLSMAAGYFGGYTAKMQDVGHKELQRMNEALSRKASVAPKCLPNQSFAMYSKRLVKDLEAKGIIRTADEIINLSFHADHKDVTRAECIRTMPTVAFPTSLLLKREEIETKKTRAFLSSQLYTTAISKKDVRTWKLRRTSSTGSVALHMTLICFPPMK